MTFTQEQRHAVETGGSIVLTIDGIACVIARADVHGHVGSEPQDGLSHGELRATLARSAQGSDWLDPVMDIYDEYDKHR